MYSPDMRMFKELLLDNSCISYTVSLIRLTVFSMSSSSWQHADVENTLSDFDFRAAPFRLLATCHSSPVLGIYANSSVPHVHRHAIKVYILLLFKFCLGSATLQHAGVF